MKRAPLNRGDILTALEQCGGIPPALAGRLCGFGHEAPEPFRLPPPAKNDGDSSTAAPAPVKEPSGPAPAGGFPFWVAGSLTVQDPELTARQAQVPKELLDAVPVTNADFLLTPEQRPLPGRPLVAWSRLWPFLREVLGRRKPGRQPDIPRVVRLLARGRALERLPRRLRRAWHPQVHLLRDRREALAPFWSDYDDLFSRLGRMRGKGGLRLSDVELARHHADFPSGIGCAGVKPQSSDYRDLTPRVAGTVVLVLGDLEQYGGREGQRSWLHLGRRLRNAGVQAWALCPCPRAQWLPAMTRAWRMACWDRGQRLPAQGSGLRAQPMEPEERQAAAARARAELLALAAPAVRVEPGLLRDLRFLLPSAVADTGTEFALFHDLASDHQGFSLPPEESARLRAKLVELDQETLCAVVKTLRHHHAYADHIFGCMEVLGLYGFLPSDQWEALIAAGVMPKDALAQARDRLWQIAAACWRNDPSFMARETAGFSLHDAARQAPVVQALSQFQAFWALAPHAPDRPVPAWVQPGEAQRFQPKLDEEEHRTVVLHGGIVPGGRQGKPLGWLSSRSHTCFVTFHPPEAAVEEPVTLELPWGRPLPEDRLDAAEAVTLASGGNSLTLHRMERPGWAVRMGYDEEGPWAEPFGGQRLSWVPGDSPLRPSGGAGTFEGSFRATGAPCWAEFIQRDASGWFASFPLGGVEFVLRWIPPGTFVMGSPPDEPGRYSDEGPQHSVTLTQGFWLGETPVTQAQWRAIVRAGRAAGQKEKLNEAPSEFKGPEDLPVESVSWEDCKAGIDALNRSLAGSLPPGFRFSLPTEAQWEYACRAGTATALYTGPITIKGLNDAPELDAIAWYGGNSGNDLEAENPEASKWEEMQYPNPKSATHRVKLKAANPWGLHDMIGNVREWCLDGQRTYSKKPVSDPIGPTGKSAFRVVRGGSWFDLALYCRSAYRSRGVPGLRNRGLGFRLAAGQEPSAAEPQAAERQGRKGGSRG